MELVVSHFNNTISWFCSYGSSICSQIQILQQANEGILGLAFSLISFVLVTVLYSTLIVPQLHKLKDLRDEIYKKIAIPDDLRRKIYEGRSMADERRLREQVIEPINEILDEYEIKESHLKEFTNIFWFTVIILLLFLYIISWKVLVLPIFLTAIFAILYKALSMYAPSANNIRDIGWLINKAFVNPKIILVIWETMQLSFNYSNRKPLFSGFKKNDLIYFSFTPGVFYTGYRFLMQITDKDYKEVFYCSYGPVKNNKNVLRILHSSGEVYYSINAGSMPLGLLEGKELKFTILIFAGAFATEESKPFVMNHDINLEKGQMPTGFSTLETMDPDRRDDGVSFKGSGSDIKEISIDESQKRSSVNFKLLKLIREDLIYTRTIKSFYDIRGKLIEKLNSECIL